MTYVRTALAASISFVAFTTAAAAQVAGPADVPSLAAAPVEATDPGDTVVVTGTRRTDRTIADSPVAVDVISGAAISQTGYTETAKVLSQLVPSFNFPQPSITDGTDVLRPATLRGLSPDQTLVLINGKRRHTSALLNINGSVGRGSAAVDLNTIPPLAIERIEVLRDGAASLYGSDAIAGVINIQLKKREGGRAQVTYGQYRTRVAGVPEVVGLLQNSAGQPLLNADGTYQPQYGERDRKENDGETLTLATNVGVPVGPGGYLNVTAEYKDRNATNRAGYDPRRQYPLVGGRVDPREFTVNRLNHRFGDAATSDMNFFVNGGYELSPSVEFYTFGSYGIRDGSSAAFYRRPAGPGTLSDLRNCNYASGSCQPFYADGFLPLINSEIEDYSAAAGIKGALAGFNYDLSYVYGHNAFDFGVSQSYNASFGPLSQVTFDAGGTRFGQHVVNLDLQRDLAVSFAKSFSIAAGAEYRRENYKVRAGDLQSYAAGPFAVAPFNAPAGAQGFPGFRPANAIDRSRHSVAGYVEADADFGEWLTVQGAGRYEHYSDFGDTVNGKLAARIAPVEGIALRGSISTGFRAPSLQQQYFSTSSTNNVNGTLVEIGTFTVDSPVARALGSQDLDAEKSLNLGGGVTLTPFRGFSLTADYYNIRIKDRIVVTENLQGAGVVTLLQAAGFNNITSARFFINGIDTRTQGVEVVGTYRVPDLGFDIGNVSLTAGFNYNKTKITDYAVLPTVSGLTLFGRTESLRLEDGQPRTKLNFGLDWDKDMLGLTLRTNRYGKVLSPGATAATDVTLDPKWITDAELRITPYKKLELAVGANNVFDVYSTRLPQGAAFPNNYFIPYSSASPFGFNGRYLYARVSIGF
ncbi:TonB-dependent receptor plug domain-containing protein [Sphingomonas montana]|uniref:TonB-dependent receptor plug domain-containing protein n=1 Tax=Sphingomonas montana TaxID=1843236 RepID=UPI00096D47F6|nr:TonB-dependent receptor [Sphingomonas montana]